MQKVAALCLLFVAGALANSAVGPRPTTEGECFTPEVSVQRARRGSGGARPCMSATRFCLRGLFLGVYPATPPGQLRRAEYPCGAGISARQPTLPPPLTR